MIRTFHIPTHTLTHTHLFKYMNHMQRKDFGKAFRTKLAVEHGVLVTVELDINQILMWDTNCSNGNVNPFEKHVCN